MATIIGLVLIAGYPLVLTKAHPAIRVAVSLILIAACIKLTASLSAARERNEIWNRSARPLRNIFSLGQNHLKEGHPEKVDAMLSRLNEGGLLFGTFFGKTNYPDYDEIFEPIQGNESAHKRVQGTGDPLRSSPATDL